MDDDKASSPIETEPMSAEARSPETDSALGVIPDETLGPQSCNQKAPLSPLTIQSEIQEDV